MFQSTRFVFLPKHSLKNISIVFGFFFGGGGGGGGGGHLCPWCPFDLFLFSVCKLQCSNYATCNSLRRYVGANHDPAGVHVWCFRAYLSPSPFPLPLRWRASAMELILTSFLSPIMWVIPNRTVHKIYSNLHPTDISQVRLVYICTPRLFCFVYYRRRNAGYFITDSNERQRFFSILLFLFRPALTPQ